LGGSLGFDLPGLRHPRWLVVCMLAFSILSVSTAAIALRLQSAAPLAVVCIASLIIVGPATYLLARAITQPLATVLPCGNVGELAWFAVGRHRDVLVDRPSLWSAESVFAMVKSILVAQLGIAPEIVTREARIVRDLGAD